MKNMAKIVKVWNNINAKHEKRLGKEKVDDKQKEDPQAKKMEKLKTTINKGLKVMRRTASNDLARDEKERTKFEEQQGRMVKVLGKYCRTIKKSKEGTQENRNKYFKSVARLAVVIDELRPDTVDGSEPDPSEVVDESVLEQVNTARFELALDTTLDDEHEEIDFEEEPETPPSQQAPVPNRPRGITIGARGQQQPPPQTKPRSNTFSGTDSPKVTGAPPTPPPSETKGLGNRFRAIDHALKELQPLDRAKVETLRDEYKNLLLMASDTKKATECLNGVDALEQKVQTLRTQLTQAKMLGAQAKLNGFKNNAVPPELARNLEGAGGPLLALVDSELDTVTSNKEYVRRKRRILPDTKDKNYHDDVTTPVQNMLRKVKATLADPASVTKNLVQEVNELVTALDTPKAHYADTSKIKPKDKEFLAQRDRKVEAIQGHQDDLRQIAEELNILLRMRARAPLAAMKEMVEAVRLDPSQTEAAGKMLAPLLQDPATREALFAVADPSSTAALALAFQGVDDANQDSYFKELVQARGGDAPFMDKLISDTIAVEMEKERGGLNPKGKFFRGKSAAIKLATKYCTTSPDGQQFIKNTAQPMIGYYKQVNDKLELDPFRMGEGEDIDKNRVHHKKMIGDMLGQLDNQLSQIPESIAKIAAEFYEQALSVAEGDEEWAATQIGGFLMLRVLNPMIASGFYGQIQGDQMRNCTLQAKLLQNMSNGVTWGGGDEGAKEEHMKDFNEIIENPDGSWAPPTQKLRTILRGVATRGQQAKQRPAPTTGGLNWSTVKANPTALRVLHQFMQATHCDEEFDLWEAAQRRPQGAEAQQVYDELIKVGAPRAANLDNSTVQKFDACARSSDWSQAPWDEAVSHIETMLQNDTMQKIIGSNDQKAQLFREKLRAIVG